MNPFDFKAALLARHAQHVVLIHFPIGLFVAAVAFDVIAAWRNDRTLAAAAYCNLLTAAVSTLPTLATGLVAWQWQLEGQHLQGVLLLHLLFGVSSSAMIWLIWFLHFRARRIQEQSPPAYRLLLELLVVALVAFTGHLGGILSGVNAPN